MEKTLRRNLSGIYIFEKFPEEEKRQPTCFEDCLPETQDKWLDSLTPEALKSLSKQLGNSLRKIGDTFDILSGEPEE